MLIIVIVAVVGAVAWWKKQGGYRGPGKFRRMVRDALKWLRAAAAREDREFVEQRQCLLRRIGDSVAGFVETRAPGVLWLVVEINPDDHGLLGVNLGEDERELNLVLPDILRRRGRDPQVAVRIRECHPDPSAVRGNPRITLTTGPARTKLLDDDRATVCPSAGGRSARLIVIGRSGESVAIPAGGGVIGRDVENCEVVVEAPTVSRRHARIQPRTGSDCFLVEDLASANGMSINSRKTEAGILRAGDILGLGRKLRLRLEMIADE
ncbi:FHA domain-containing protein [Amycolatopsis sp. lyj-109]|uniref:FHA domain-containing protein n=1 Tax=Amycolatopsis sp. lyj-109 TaxID=2789287 RepID=UPI00397A4C65